MFETVVPETFRKRSRRLFYETLPLSITIHALAIVGAVGATQWNVVFPDHSPRLTAQYALLTIPDPPPPPPPPAAPKPPQQIAPPVPDNQIVAPTVIPDTIPVVAPELPQPIAEVAPVEQGVEGGVEGGIVGGIVAAQVASLPLPAGPVIAEDGRVHIERDAKLPMVAVRQEYPMYPEDARMKGIEDSLVVRYVIGKDGRVKEVKIIDPPKYGQFADAATKAIRYWRFQPLMENGQAEEVVHELTVYFQLK